MRGSYYYIAHAAWHFAIGLYLLIFTWIVLFQFKSDAGDLAIYQTTIMGAAPLGAAFLGYLAQTCGLTLATTITSAILAVFGCIIWIGMGFQNRANRLEMIVFAKTNQSFLMRPIWRSTLSALWDFNLFAMHFLSVKQIVPM